MLYNLVAVLAGVPVLLYRCLCGRYGRCGSWWCGGMMAWWRGGTYGGMVAWWCWWDGGVVVWWDVSVVV